MSYVLFDRDVICSTFELIMMLYIDRDLIYMKYI
jgi:hypothetical protein